MPALLVGYRRAVKELAGQAAAGKMLLTFSAMNCRVAFVKPST
jgi:hypothetical protein